MPDYPDALNNLGYALLLSGHDEEARALYEKALALQPDFPEALNNLGLLFGRAGTWTAPSSYFRDALSRRARLRRSGQQPGAGPGRKGQAGGGDRASRGVAETDAGYEARLYHARQDLPQRRAQTAKDVRYARAASAEQSSTIRRPWTCCGNCKRQLTLVLTCRQHLAYDFATMRDLFSYRGSVNNLNHLASPSVRCVRRRWSMSS